MFIDKTPKDANDALRMGMDLKKLIDGARRFSHSKLTNFDEYKKLIYLELVDQKQLAGF